MENVFRETLNLLGKGDPCVMATVVRTKGSTPQKSGDKLLVRNMAKGETVWEICNEIYAIPFWLLASYNPGKEISSIPVGESIVVPIISGEKSSIAFNIAGSSTLSPPQ